MAPITKIILSTLALLTITPVLAAPLNARQLAGEGAAANSILSSTDNGVGYGVENAEDNTAALISSVKPATPPVVRSLLHEVTMLKRQADKIANGAAAILDAAGAPTAGDAVKSNGDSVDGTLTSGAADAGAQVGNTEESTLEGVGSDVP